MPDNTKVRNHIAYMFVANENPLFSSPFHMIQPQAKNKGGFVEGPT